jgi:regulator of sigma E protease
MSGFGGSLLAFLVGISVLIAVHEFGHFWVARRLGVKVLRFSIGFGRSIWTRRFGPDRTEFAIGILPLGGYVKMLDEREAPVSPQELQRAFNRQPLRVRNAVVVAGPLFNFLFAIFAYWLMFISGVPALKPVVGAIEEHSHAASAGFREQDRLLRIGDHDTPTWDAATMELLDAALDRRQTEVHVRGVDDRERVLIIDFAGVPEALDKGGLLSNLGLSVWRPKIPAVIDRLVADAPAERSGMQPGDKVLSVDGQPVANWTEWVDYVRARPEQAMRVRVLRNTDELDLSLVPESVGDGKGESIGRIGAYVRSPENNILRTEVRYGPLNAVGKSLEKTWEMTQLTLRTLWGMLLGRASVENISGPISIAQYAGYSASVGLASFLKFLAIVSISLGVLNLLPVPILDGGHLLFNALEWIKGSPLSDYAQQIGQQLGIFLLLMLMGLAFYNDLSRLFGS